MAARKLQTLDISDKKEKIFYRPYYQQDGKVQLPRLPDNIYIVGCGGNGGYLIPLIARYISQAKSDLIKSIRLHLIDGDVVEEKNVTRQNFTENEIGQNKASALADRCNRNLGMNVQAIEEFFVEKHLSRIDYTDLIIGCVDRHEVRNLISRRIEQSTTAFYIDVGNESSAGQLFMSGWPKIVSSNGYESISVYHPLLIPNFYPEVQKADPTKSAPSCADQTAGGFQRMSVNVKAAMLAFSAFEAILSPEPIPYYEIGFGPDNYKTWWLRDLKETVEGMRKKLTR
jgi:PRTRC genetic system ThiF family protein